MKLLKKKRTEKENARIEFLHDALLIDKSILVLGDLHIGYEEHIAEDGIFPRVQLKEIIEKLNEIFWNLSMKGVRIKQIVILGDLKHEFGGISDAEWRETLRLLDYLDEKIVGDRGNKRLKKKNERIESCTEDNKSKKKNERIILVKGNHDNILGPIAKKRDVILKDYYNYKEICFMHGNKLHGDCFKKSRILILGHLHPSITLSDKYKREKYKCFLRGEWRFERKNREVYILPSFSPISFGFELNSIEDSNHDGEFLIIKDKFLENFEVIIYNNKENKEYNFRKLGKLMKK